MDERVVQFRVGVMVLATLIISVILVLLFSEGPQVLKPRYTVYIDFPEAPGVTPDTPIKKSGILIGRVTNVELLEEGGARVTAAIDSDKPIRRNEVARISTSLLGDSMINIVPSDKKDQPRTPIEDGAQLTGVAYDDPIQVVAKLQDRLSGAIGSVSRTSDELGAVAHQVSDLLRANEQKINRIVAHADETTATLQQTLRHVNDVVGNPETKAKIQEGISQLPELMQETRQTIVNVNKMVGTMDKNLQNLDQFTGALGDQGQQVIGQLGQSAQKLDSVLTEMLKLSQTINSQEGSLGQLVHDPELYQRLNNAAGNVEELTRQMRPILRDARVLSDQLARHPEKLGIRGAIERSTGTK